MQINQLSAVDTVNAGDLLALWATDNGDTRKCSITTLLAYIQNNLAAGDNKITQYNSPNASGQSIQLNNDSLSVWLILTPLAGYAAMTLVLPAVANCIDKQELLINCTQAITTLTVNGNGATVNGALTVFTANGFMRLRFDGVLKVWYRVG